MMIEKQTDFRDAMSSVNQCSECRSYGRHGPIVMVFTASARMQRDCMYHLTLLVLYE